MEISLKKIYLTKDVLAKLILCKWDTPQKSYNVYMFYKEIEDKLIFFYQEKNKIVKTLGEISDSGKYEVKKENMELFKQEVESLLNQNVDIPDPGITMEDITKAAYSENESSWISPVEMYEIEKFLDLYKKKES